MADFISEYSRAVAVTASDTTVLAATDALFFLGGTSGAMAVVMANGPSAPVTFSGLTNTIGQILPLRVTKVMATGLVAVTGVIALYR